MSSQSFKSVTLSPTKICPKAICGTCDKYDGWEPSKECLNLGIGCQYNKPANCVQCGHYKKSGPCSVGYFTTPKAKACRQAINKIDLYLRGY